MAAMLSPLLSTAIWMLCILHSSALQSPTIPEEKESRGLASYTPIDSTGASDQNTVSSESASMDSTFPWPTVEYITPAITSQGMTVTTIVPNYEICNLPGANATSCSTSFKTTIATECSTVLTGYFQRYTVSECDEIVTFSSQIGYSMASPTPEPQKRADGPLDTIPYVQNMTTYYAAPWQSIAANDPSGIQVKVCGSSDAINDTCSYINEVWIVRTEYVPVYSSKDVSISTTVTSDVVLVLGSTQSLTITSGAYSLSTQLTSTTSTATNLTSTSTITDATTYHTVFVTTTITGRGSTLTRYIKLASTPVSATSDPLSSTIPSDTAILSTTTLKSTITLTPVVTVTKTR